MSRRRNHKIWQCPPHTFERQPGKKKDTNAYQFKSWILGQKAGLLTSRKKGVRNGITAFTYKEFGYAVYIPEDLRLKSSITVAISGNPWRSAAWVSALSLCARNGNHQLLLYQGYYNFVRPHRGLKRRIPAKKQIMRKRQRRTPALAAKLTDHVWSLKEFMTKKVFINY